MDIQTVMQDATTKGINLLEAMLQKVQPLTGVTQSEINKYMTRGKSKWFAGSRNPWLCPPAVGKDRHCR